MKLAIVIPSAWRWDRVKTKTLFPNAFVVVPELEEKVYKSYSNVITHPDTIKWITPKRNWILDTFFAKGYDCIFMIDDDCLDLCRMTSEHISKVEYCEELIYNSAVIANEIWTVVFCYNNLPTYKHYSAIKPFVFASWLKMWAYWILKTNLRFDERFSVKEDLDFAMQVLHKHRRIRVDNRYAFRKDKTFWNKWWCSIFRTTKIEEECTQKLKNKRWKSISITHWKLNYMVNINF